MAEVKTKSGIITYEVQGDGPPLVLLRGLGRTVRHWLGFDALLAKSFRVITLDLRGIGRSKVPSTWGTSVYDMAGDIVAVLDDLPVSSAHIMGVSLGGMIALAAGLKFPERCRSLIVINTSIAGQRTMRVSARAIRTLSAAVLKPDLSFHTSLVEVLVGPDCSPERRAEVASRYAEIAREDGGLYIGTVLKQLAAAGRFLVVRRLRQMRVPTLVVYSTGDRFVPNINSRKLVQHLPDAKLVPIFGAGHEPTIDKADELVRIVCDWNEEISARSASSTREPADIASLTQSPQR